ncbi:hypothetical protein [Nocardia jejuensis]|uniref:hypothetical protein n=1 Tax=Nocardia jejuensis TaxID=328049 RepID=UPI0012FA5D1F|nr:hypothetical protein [Nocardia jejuensis]
MIELEVAGQSRTTREQRVTDQTVDRLLSEFGDQYSRWWVAGIVRACLQDLAGIPLDAMGELGERSARQRLLDMSSSSARLGGYRSPHLDRTV